MTRNEKNEEIQKEILQEENKEKTKRIIKIIIKITLIIVTISFLFFSYTTYISTKKIGVREYRINNNKIPESFNGLKIIQFSDIHFGTTMFNEDINKLVKIINIRKPDLVVFTGDLLSKTYNIKSDEQEQLIKELKNISATLGKYAILGDEDNEKIATIFNQSDFTILRDEYDLIYKDNKTPILLIGLSSLLNGKQDVEKAYSYFREETHNSNIYTITIAHEPDSVDEISPYQTDLFLAGHSHNGNIRIPFINKSFIKVKGAKKYDQNNYKVDNTDIYITSGLGTKKGIRLFCRPSINFYRLSQN